MSNTVRERLEFITSRVTPAATDVTTTFQGIANIHIPAGVFDPSRGRSANKMAEAIRACPPCDGDRMLEIGIGSGALTIFTARFAQLASIEGVDVDDVALKAAIQNLQEHGVTNAHLHCSDLFNDVASDGYDYIIFNAPTAHPLIERNNPAHTTVWDLTQKLKPRFVEGIRAGYLNPQNPHAKALMTYTVYEDYNGLQGIDFQGLNVSRIGVEKDDVSEVGILVLERTSPAPTSI